MPKNRFIRLGLSALLLPVALWAAACAVPLGPGYTVEKQAVGVQNSAAAGARVAVRADYTLRNTGKQPLTFLEIRLPAAAHVHLAAVSAAWDSQPVQLDLVPGAPDVFRLSLGSPWPVKQVHALHLQYDIAPAAPGSGQLDLVSDSFFYLPPDLWLVALLPPPGTFSAGGAPPKGWLLHLQLPSDLRAVASGEPRKRSGGVSAPGSQDFLQPVPGHAPFVLAGRYFQQEIHGAPSAVFVWTNNPVKKSQAEPLARDVQRIATTYDAMFGPRDKTDRPLWLIENPIFSKAPAPVATSGALLTESEIPLPADTGLFFFPSSNSSAAPPSLSAGLARSLVDAWLSPSRRPGAESITPPLQALPEYAASVALENLRGSSERADSIRGALKKFDDARPASREGDGQASDYSDPGKSLLFFYALEDKLGRETLHKALRHMVQSRRHRGYDLEDFIGALEQESRQNAAAFLRLWLKRPGIPAEFRARYAGQTAGPLTSQLEAAK